MELKISKNVAAYLGEERMRAIGLEWNERSWKDHYVLDLAVLTRQQITGLRGWLEESVACGVRGPKVLIHDIDMWFRALDDAGAQHARTVHQFASLVTEYLRKVNGHRVYKRLDDEGSAYACYYVNKIEYHPEAYSSGGGRIPPRTDMDLLHYELGGRLSTTVGFHSEDIFGMSASEALAKAGFYVETDELRTKYLAETKRFNEVAPVVGKQYIANGSGTDNLDGNGGSSGWSRYSHNRLSLNGAKVVIDREDEGRKPLASDMGIRPSENGLH